MLEHNFGGGQLNAPRKPQGPGGMSNIVWIPLAIAGALGVGLAIVMAMSSVAAFTGVALLMAGTVYVVSVFAVFVMTREAELASSLLWLIRLGLPILGAVIVWLVLVAAGF